MEISTGAVVALLLALPVAVKTVDKLVDVVISKRKNHKNNNYLKALSDNQLTISLTLKQVSDSISDMEERHRHEITGMANRITQKIDDGVIPKLNDIKLKIKA